MQKKIKSFDGIEINYQINRVSDKFLIFLHGAGGDLNAWKDFVLFFNKKGYSTIAIDLRGHGFSDKPLDKKYYSMENYANDVNLILNKEKIKNFFLIGHCFGGMVLFTFNRLFPNYSSGNILINSTYKIPFLNRLFKVRSILYLLAGFLSMNQKFSKNRGHGNYDKSFSKGDLINFKRIYNDIKDNGLTTLLLIYSCMFSFNEKKILKKIKRPFLIIYGERDKFFGKGLIKKMSKNINKSELFLIPDSNHWPIYEKNIEIENRILNFLIKNKF